MKTLFVYSRSLMLLLSLTLLGLTAGCATYKDIEVKQVVASPVALANQATAGAVNVDITPGPGMPMAGYSIMGSKGQGFRTRLKARVIYINDGKGHSTAIVQTDLSSGSLLLHHKIASRVAKQTGLKASDIVITATHSHSAPTNTFENVFYNKHMSAGQGLEQEFLEFLTSRISEGILQAHDERRPAKVATGSLEQYGLTRNRSLDSYVLNDNVEKYDLEDPESKFKAVDPKLYMIRVDVQDKDGQYKPLAAYSSYSIHATSISANVEVYNGDLYAYAQRDLEWFVSHKYNTPWQVVHGLSTATQGDMAPALELQDSLFSIADVDFKASKKVGQGLGKLAIDLFESLENKLTSDVNITTAAREIDIRKNNIVEGIELCEDAVVGSALTGGAFERRTPFIGAIPFFKEGNIMSRRWIFTEGCQGNKAHAGFKYIQPLFEPKDTFPRLVMFQIIRINDAAFMPLPFESTIEAGHRMVERVKAELNKNNDFNVKTLWVTSVANGYFGYTTTPEEYARQNYEGGHTLYGKNSTPYITAQLGILAKDVAGAEQPVNEMLADWKYDNIVVNNFLTKSEPSQGQRKILTTPELTVVDEENEENFISFEWQDVGASEIKFHKPLVRIEKKNANGWTLMQNNGEPINDEGYDLEVRFNDELEQGMAEYQARWYNPVADGQYRFVIAPRGKQTEITSSVFNVSGQGEKQISSVE